MQSLANGTELGAYTIVRLIGRGGMGEVYEAYEHKLQRRVALKVIAPQKAGSHGEVDLVRRFLQEARTLAQVNHPNVVTIYSIDRIKDTQFIAMEFVDGASFKDLFELFALSADEATPIFLQLLEGLRSLHDNKILHRDIKPHNLMIRPNGQVKILDFGIAKRLNDGERENTTVGVVVGTLSYLPPEVLYGTAANVRSDLWSMGAIFYECMVGQPLVSMHNMKIKGIKAAMNSDVIFPQECLPWIPAEMRAIVGKLCDRQPEMRYLSASEASEDLRRFQLGRAPSVPGAATALNRAIENIGEIKDSVKGDKLNSPKTKRNLTLSILGGKADSVLSIPELEDEPVTTQSVRDSLSARRRAQQKARSKHNSWSTIIFSGVGALLVAGLAIKLISSRTKEPVKKAEATTVEILRLSSPSENQALWLDPTQIPTLSWSRPVAAKEYELQIASDPNFNAIVIREEVNGNSYRPSRILGEGEYFWQLWPMHGPAQPVSGGHFSISFLAPIDLTWPKPEQIFDLARGSKIHSVNLAWKCKPGGQEYRAQVSANPAFTELVLDHVTAECNWSDLKLPAGGYYWRVRVETPAVAQVFSSGKQAFVIKHAAGPAQVQAAAQAAVERSVERRLMAPQLKISKQSLVLELNGPATGRDIASYRKQLSAIPELQWLHVKGARSYGLQLSWTTDFSKLLSEETVATTHFEWAQVVPGRIFWRVRAQGETLPGAYSAAGSIDVRLPVPSIGSVYTFTEDAPFEWEPVPFAEKYIVQWSVERKLASISETVVNRPQVPLEFSGKPLFVRVAAANGLGERVSGFSQVATVTMEKPLKLAAPGLMTPPKGAKVVVGKSGRISVVFSWSKVENADQYFIEVAETPDFTKVIKSKGIKGNHWLLKGAKFNGKVYWRVRTVGRGGPSSWAVSGFEVR